MEYLTSIGIFFGGLGLLLSSFGIFWFVSVYQQKHKPEKERIKQSKGDGKT